MNKGLLKSMIAPIVMTTLFIVFSIFVMTIDVQNAGFAESKLGFANINIKIFNSIKTTVSEKTGDYFDMGSNILLGGCIAFYSLMFILGMIQLISRKHLLKVDTFILATGVVLAVAIILWIAFSIIPINTRPLDDKPSYPSTHVMNIIVTCGLIYMYLQKKKWNVPIMIASTIVAALLIVGMMLGRLYSLDHYFTDIIGGILLGLAIILWLPAFEIITDIIKEKGLKNKEQ